MVYVFYLDSFGELPHIFDIEMLKLILKSNKNRFHSIRITNMVIYFIESI